MAGCSRAAQLAPIAHHHNRSRRRRPVELGRQLVGAAKVFDSRSNNHHQKVFNFFLLVVVCRILKVETTFRIIIIIQPVVVAAAAVGDLFFIAFAFDFRRPPLVLLLDSRARSSFGAAANKKLSPSPATQLSD